VIVWRPDHGDKVASIAVFQHDEKADEKSDEKS
jgi:hypothetical protein